MNIRLYLSVLLLPVMLLSAIILPSDSISASSILQWEEVLKPGRAGNIIVTPSDISRIAVSKGNVIYAVDSINNRVYRSNNSGDSWDELTNNLLRAGAGFNFTNIAVAADSAGLVAVVTGGGTAVFISNDGGKSWNNTNLGPINGTIQCIAISKEHVTKGNRDIAIGTAGWVDPPIGQVLTLTVGTSFSSWIDQEIALTVGTVDVAAIAFSPNYKTDNTILAVAATYDNITTIQSTKLYKGYKVDTNFNWNYADTGTPAEICTENTTAVDNITASISLPSDFSGITESKRTFFISYSRPGSGNNGVYRSHYTWHSGNAYRLYTGSENITSIAYDGTVLTGRMLVGFTDRDILYPTVMVKRATVNQTEETAGWYPATMPPTGPGNACVAWGYITDSNTDNITPAFCSTGRLTGSPEHFNESAFSRSRDYGNNWEQTSLINTNLRISDIAPFPDSRGLLMSSYSPNGPEAIWRSAGDPIGLYWGRLVTLNAPTNRLILRVSPNYKEDYTVYAAVVDNKTTSSANITSSLMLSTPSRGNYWNLFHVPWPIIDFIVQDSKTLYMAMDGGYIRKTTDGGINFGSPVWSGLDDINMLALTPGGHVLAGSRDCKVSYSTDGGARFKVIDYALHEKEGDVQVVADPRYEQNHIIYAADNLPDSGIWRWSIGTSTRWELMDQSLDILSQGEEFCGLATGPEGTLYALRSEISDNTHTGGMDRTLNPADPNEFAILWDQVNHTVPPGTEFDPMINFANTLPHLKISGNELKNDLWAADLYSNRIYMFTDDICKAGPTLTGPDTAGCNPATGRSEDVDLRWEQLSLADQNEIQLAQDAFFASRLTAVEPVENPYLTPVEESGIAAAILHGEQLECGHFYYWRVRIRHAVTGENITSPWSAGKKFTVKPGYKVTTPAYGVTLLNPENGCSCPCTNDTAFSWSPYFKTTVYRFQLAGNAEMKDLLVDTTVQGTTSYLYTDKLKCGQPYFWRVKAIQPVQSDWSAVFNLKTQPAASTRSATILPSNTPAWIWVLIGMCLALSICMFILILRRYNESY